MTLRAATILTSPVRSVCLVVSGLWSLESLWPRPPEGTINLSDEPLFFNDVQNSGNAAVIRTHGRRGAAGGVSHARRGPAAAPPGQPSVRAAEPGRGLVQGARRPAHRRTGRHPLGVPQAHPQVAPRCGSRARPALAVLVCPPAADPAPRASDSGAAVRARARGADLAAPPARPQTKTRVRRRRRRNRRHA